MIWKRHLNIYSISKFNRKDTGTLIIISISKCMHGPVEENSIWGGRSAGWWPVTILANFCCFFSDQNV